ncbi:Glucosamine-6-phosphate deaminase 1 [Clostridium paraputrificum]|uniref:Glucosamine-6-phosphate deaminase n=1 Tax=Clostridium paraputrificum TaxID=29363 RepID=A0A6N3CNY0_9CLOT|nr:glucosamine-6-phosphate deaminase [Clostridium sp.]MBS5987895.1 glucosamine-6-phosphate deaminase [Clostridium sp.]
MSMKVYVFNTEREVDEFVGQHVSKFIQNKKDAVLGFATGSTPLGTYDYLISEYNKGNIDFSEVVAFNLDEYVGVENDHPRSFAKFMRDYLFNKINIKQENIHALNGKAEDMEEECNRYEREIDQNPIDIQLLGIGMDGHIAYNEPGSPFDGGCHVVNLHQQSILSSLDYGFDCIEDVPTQGVTQGINTIMKAKQLIMIAKGEKKAKLVEYMLKGEITEEFPSTIIRRHEKVIVVLDEAAAKYLKGEDYERN